MTTKTLQIRLEAEEYDALAELARIEVSTMSDFCRHTLRLGVAAAGLNSLQFQDTARRSVDREVGRKLHNLVLQCALILHELGERAGVPLANVKADAAEATDEHYLDGDALEAALADAQTTGAGGGK